MVQIIRTHSNLSLEMFGTLGFWQKEDVAPPREAGSTTKPAPFNIITGLVCHRGYLKTIKNKSTAQELVGNEKLDENYGKVEELAEDETVEVDVVPE